MDVLRKKTDIRWLIYRVSAVLCHKLTKEKSYIIVILIFNENLKFCALSVVYIFPAESKMLPINISQGTVSKLQIPVSWQHQ